MLKASFLKGKLDPSCDQEQYIAKAIYCKSESILKFTFAKEISTQNTEIVPLETHIENSALAQSQIF